MYHVSHIVLKSWARGFNSSQFLNHRRCSHTWKWWGYIECFIIRTSYMHEPHFSKITIYWAFCDNLSVQSWGKKWVPFDKGHWRTGNFQNDRKVAGSFRKNIGTWVEASGYRNVTFSCTLLWGNNFSDTEICIQNWKPLKPPETPWQSFHICIWKYSNIR